MTQPPCAVCRNTEGIQLIVQRLFKLTALEVISRLGWQIKEKYLKYYKSKYYVLVAKSRSCNSWSLFQNQSREFVTIGQYSAGKGKKIIKIQN